MPRADRYMSGDVGEVCVRRPRSRCGTYKASVNIVHIRCQWKLRDIRLERRVPYKGSRNRGEVVLVKRWDHASSKFLVFQTVRPALEIDKFIIFIITIIYIIIITYISSFFVKLKVQLLLIIRIFVVF